MKKLKNLNNRGMTLVELLIGIVILSIIVTPLLHTFVTSSTTERKAREYGNASTAAQNIAETIQAFDAKGDFAGNMPQMQLTCDAANYYKAVTTGSITSVFQGVLDPSRHIENYVSTTAPPNLDVPVAGKTLFSGVLTNYTYQGQKYDAVISADLSNGFNATPVSIGNPMDAVIDMSGAEAEALSSYRAACEQYSTGEYLGAPLSLSQLHRKITVDVKEVSGVYIVDVKFDYSTSYYYYKLDDADKKSLTIDFSCHSLGSATVSKKVISPDYAAFSLFLFYDADPGLSNRSADEIAINSPAEISGNPGCGDFNVFLVNSGDPAAAGFHTTVSYKLQKFEGINTSSRVFTNLGKGQITYFAYQTPSTRKTIAVTEKLVESQPRDRFINIKISLYRHGSAPGTPPLLTLNTTKLT